MLVRTHSECSRCRRGKKLIPTINLEQKKLPPLMSVIILNFNGLKFISGCLNSLFNTNYTNYEIIFVDNNSYDGSVEFVKIKFGKHPGLKIIELDKNYGVSGGNNIGAHHAQGKYLFFLNIDTEVHKDCLNEIINVFEKDKTIGAVQSKLLFLWDEKRINSMGHYLTSWGAWQNYVPHEQFDNNKKYSNIQEIFIAHGAAIAVNSELFKKVGMFDTDYFMYSEETDLCWRIWLSGKRIVIVPSSIVYHYEGGVAGGGVLKPTPLRVFHGTRNQLITILKNYSNRNLYRYFPFIMLLTFNNLVRYFLINPRFLTHNILAIIDFIKQFKNTWKKRIRIQYLIRCISDDVLFQKGLIRAHIRRAQTRTRIRKKKG